VGQANDRAKVGERYVIVVQGEFGELLTTAFADVTVTAGERETVMIATVRDNEELYGLMDRLRDHGVQILNVGRLDVGRHDER
jgi:hypothetical protein